MGKIDIKTNEYMRDATRFADVFNYYLYDGRQVIKPEKLRELSSSAVALPYGTERNSSEAVQKYRDVFKTLAAMEDDTAAYLLLGIENQAEEHTAMPVRNMLYDATQYARQVEDAARSHLAERKQNREKLEAGQPVEGEKISSGEFLSGFYKSDKLLPVITLVIYWSPDEWNAPRSIHEMLALPDKELLKFLPDYRINLIFPKEIDDMNFEKFHSEMAEALQYIKYSKDKANLERVINENPKFSHLDRRTAEVVNVVTNSNLKFEDGETEVNMCVALEEMKKESEQNGKLEAIKNIMKNLKMTAQQAMEAVGIPKDQQQTYLQKL